MLHFPLLVVKPTLQWCNLGCQDTRHYKYIVAVFPSACGKTNLAMMQPRLPGYKVYSSIHWRTLNARMVRGGKDFSTFLQPTSEENPSSTHQQRCHFIFEPKSSYFIWGFWVSISIKTPFSVSLSASRVLTLINNLGVMWIMYIYTGRVTV